jgi:xanthine dehydrogenase YagS FAD-binding subunit
MEPFKYTRAHDSHSAINAVMAGSAAKFLGGGTNLADLMKLHVETPKELVDINTLPLTQIEALPGGGVLIGALVRNSDLAYHPDIVKRYPVLSEALLSGASPQLRNMATVGGNLLQRVRCPYFYDTSFPCNKRSPGSGCSAINGYNRTHAILGTSDKCIATHPSDMSVALTALDATIHVEGPKGKRVIPINNFFLLPGQTPQFETTLGHAELITHVELPAMDATHSHYLKVRDRASYEFALTSAAVVLNVLGGRVQSSRIALGGVGTKPWRAHQAEAVLKGAVTGGNIYLQAANAELKDARAFKDNGFKIELTRRTLVRALQTVEGMA